jgi:hypothetical protein
LAVAGTVGVLVYLVAARLLGLREVRQLFGAVVRR